MTEEIKCSPSPPSSGLYFVSVPSLLPWLLVAKKQTFWPAPFLHSHWYDNVPALSSEPFSSAQLKKKTFHMRPNSVSSPFYIFLLPLPPHPPPSVWKENKVIQIRKLRNSVYIFRWDLIPYWIGFELIEVKFNPLIICHHAISIGKHTHTPSLHLNFKHIAELLKQGEII